MYVATENKHWRPTSYKETHKKGRRVCSTERAFILYFVASKEYRQRPCNYHTTAVWDSQAGTLQQEHAHGPPIVSAAHRQNSIRNSRASPAVLQEMDPFPALSFYRVFKEAAIQV